MLSEHKSLQNGVEGGRFFTLLHVFASLGLSNLDASWNLQATDRSFLGFLEREGRLFGILQDRKRCILIKIVNWSLLVTIH